MFQLNILNSICPKATVKAPGIWLTVWDLRKILSTVMPAFVAKGDCCDKCTEYLIQRNIHCGHLEIETPFFEQEKFIKWIDLVGNCCYRGELDAASGDEWCDPHLNSNVRFIARTKEVGRVVRHGREWTHSKDEIVLKVQFKHKWQGSSLNRWMPFATCWAHESRRQVLLAWNLLAGHRVKMESQHRCWSFVWQAPRQIQQTWNGNCALRSVETSNTLNGCPSENLQSILRHPKPKLSPLAAEKLQLIQ